MEKEIANTVLQVFTENTGVKVKWKPAKIGQKDKGFDGQIDIILTKGNKILLAELKRTVNLANIPAIIKLHDFKKNAVVVAEEIKPEVRKYLKSIGINYMDATGNAYIQNEDIFIMLENNRNNEHTMENKAKPFSKTGLKVTYILLIIDIKDELLDVSEADLIDMPGDLKNTTIRQIAKITGSSLDTVHKTINGLKELNYLLPLTKDKLTWNNKNELIEKWVVEYNIRLKPTLKLGNFRFANDQDFYNWKSLKLDNQLTRWGGEAAGDLLTGYLKPERLTLYTVESTSALMKKLRIIPDPNGYIELYKKFWDHDNPKTITVSPLLTYTDLINSGNSRNIETANKIYAKFFQHRS